MLPRPVTCTLTALAAALLLPAVALANDTAVGGQGASFGPIAEDRAAMAAEHIRIRLDDNVFHVHATYHLVNLTDEPLALEVGFPEYVCTWGECLDGVYEAFKDMRTTVRGEPVPPVVRATGADSEWSEHYPRIWVFPVTFGPRERVEVVHTYRVIPSQSAMGNLHFSYVVRTGANWGAPIGSAIFELDLPADLCGLHIWPEDTDAARLGYITLTGQTATDDREALDASLDAAAARHPMLPLRSQDTGRWQVRWEHADWVPEEDFHVNTTPWDACLMELNCPWLGELHSEDREATVQRLAQDHSPERLRQCRNLAWAITGYGFTSADLGAFFHVPDAPAFRNLVALPHAPDPGWTEDRLTPQMLDYARLLRDAERMQRSAEP